MGRHETGGQTIENGMKQMMKGLYQINQMSGTGSDKEEKLTGVLERFRSGADEMGFLCYVPLPKHEVNSYQYTKLNI